VQRYIGFLVNAILFGYILKKLAGRGEIKQVDLLRGVSEEGKKSHFCPHEGFLREYSPAI
jgi:hypothetical protein